LAERAAFKGHFQRAIDCYRDALYYLQRDTGDPAGNEAAERILREIDILRARMSAEATSSSSKSDSQVRRRSRTDEV
jgi:hypothetical protein